MTRKYIKTHPWIDFSLNLSQFDYKFWIRMGQIQAKCNQIAGVILRPSTAKELHKIYLAKGVLATTAIEGNTLSEQEVMEHMEGTLNLPPSKKYLEQEIENIIQACNQIADTIAKTRNAPITLEDLKKYNALVLNKLELEEEVTPGEIRTYSVIVGNYRGAPAEDCEYLLTKLCDFLNTKENFPELPGYECSFAVLKAVLAHLYFAWIHPFGDGNGRTARLLELRILLESGVPKPAAQLLSNYYNETRNEYYRMLSIASRRRDGEPMPFIEYALTGYLESLEQQLDVIKKQQIDVAWRDYVYELFKGKNKKTDIRRRSLVLDLSKEQAPVPLSEVITISSRMVNYYKDRTQKTLTRDLNVLSEMELIKKDNSVVSPNKEKILAFLPWRNY